MFLECFWTRVCGRLDPPGDGYFEGEGQSKFHLFSCLMNHNGKKILDFIVSSYRPDTLLWGFNDVIGWLVIGVLACSYQA